MGCGPSKSEYELDAEDGVYGGGLDGWAIGRAASIPQNLGAFQQTAQSTSRARVSLNSEAKGVRTEEVAVVVPTVAAPAPAASASDAKLPPLRLAPLLPDTPVAAAARSVQAFPAFVLCDFVAWDSLRCAFELLAFVLWVV